MSLIWIHASKNFCISKLLKKKNHGFVIFAISSNLAGMVSSVNAEGVSDLIFPQVLALVDLELHHFLKMYLILRWWSDKFMLNLFQLRQLLRGQLYSKFGECSVCQVATILFLKSHLITFVIISTYHISQHSKSYLLIWFVVRSLCWHGVTVLLKPHDFPIMASSQPFKRT